MQTMAAATLRWLATEKVRAAESVVVDARPIDDMYIEFVILSVHALGNDIFLIVQLLQQPPNFRLKCLKCISKGHIIPSKN